jgi:hypothetical protein
VGGLTWLLHCIPVLNITAFCHLDECSKHVVIFIEGKWRHRANNSRRGLLRLPTINQHAPPALCIEVDLSGWCYRLLRRSYLDKKWRTQYVIGERIEYMFVGSSQNTLLPKNEVISLVRPFIWQGVMHQKFLLDEKFYIKNKVWVKKSATGCP